MKDELKELQDKLKRKVRLCDGWKKSDDRGACYAYEVQPIKDAIEKLILSKTITPDKCVL